MPRLLLTNRTSSFRPMTYGETATMIYEHACKLYGRRSMTTRLFTSLFGANNLAIAKLWMLICDTNPLYRGADGFVEPKHLLWTLTFLKQYTTEDVLASVAGVSPKTFRKHVRRTMDRINACYPSVVSGLLFVYFKNFN